MNRFTSLLIVLICMLLSACEGPTRGPNVYHGVPNDSNPVCSWHLMKPEKGECVADGRQYSCIRQKLNDGERFWEEVSCTNTKFDLKPVNDLLERIAK